MLIKHLIQSSLMEQCTSYTGNIVTLNRYRNTLSPFVSPNVNSHVLILVSNRLAQGTCEHNAQHLYGSNAQRHNRNTASVLFDNMTQNVRTGWFMQKGRLFIAREGSYGPNLVSTAGHWERVVQNGVPVGVVLRPTAFEV
uniref:Uncharacterized protein n=1 Tax=Cacopsylla melanoneura TaxID=428564 RepID=A0A8D8W1B4_9HEMI